MQEKQSLIWICPKCQEQLGEYNGYCLYCKLSDDIYIYNPDRYYIRDVCIYHLSRGGKPLTPQEELFSKLFNHEKILVKDMDILTLRAHREELSKIAFEARARLTAVDDEEDGRKKNGKAKGQGFERSLNTDDTASNAINTIKERQKKLNKSERIQEGLKKLYELAGSDNSGREVAKVMSNKNIAEAIKKDKEAGTVRGPVNNPFVIVGHKETVTKADETDTKTKLFNPFERKENNE